jgi:hypothetical protein
MTESQLIKKFNTLNWESMIVASENLAAIASETAVNFLKQQLSSTDSFKRNAAALGMMEHPSKLYGELIRLRILELGTSEKIGTLVFALENFDTSDHLDNICEWHFNGSAEVQMSTSDMLFNQTFLVSKEQLTKVNEMLSANGTTLEELEVDFVMRIE